MPEGLLIGRGTMSLDLFWPAAESDGDTVKVTLASGDAFTYSATGDRSGLQPTHAFEGAVVAGAGRKSPIDKKNRVTVRLQGVDTTELHYAPGPLPKGASITQKMRDAYRKLCKQYRQPFGETAPVVLRAAMAGGSNVLPCRVETRVDHPNEVFDTYGRMIGDVIVEAPSGEINLNRFLVQEGWAFPAFYASMRPDEIQELLALARAARKTTKGIWKAFTQKPGKFNFNMQYRAGKTVSNPEPGEDAGPALFPKFFRRQTVWACQHAAGATKQDFRSFLKAAADGFVTTKSFLNNKPKRSTLDAIYKSGAFQIQPEDMVFEERASTLIGSNGKPVENWFAAAARA